MIEFRQFSTVSCELGEGPVFDDRTGSLIQCDVLGRTVHSFDLATGAHRYWTFPTEVGSIGLAESGCLVVALRHSVGLFDRRDGSFKKLADIEAERGADTRLNDGKVGPDGAFWVGSMDNRGLSRHDPIGTLYRVTADGQVEEKVRGIIISNGLAFSPDGKIMYHSDSYAGWLDRWDIDPVTGTISNNRRIAEFEDRTGWPDGGATDVAGNYWSAGISAQRLNRLTPYGTLLDWYEVPLSAPTMPCFGGADGRSLFVTSLRVGQSPDLLAAYPMSGTTVIGQSSIAGSPVARFRDV